MSVNMRLSRNLLIALAIVVVYQGCLPSGFKSNSELNSQNGGQAQAPTNSSEFQKARAVLQNSCVSCHSPGGQAAHARLDYANEEDFVANGLVVKGSPDESRIVYRTQGYMGNLNGPSLGSANMPLNGSISTTDFQVLRNWVTAMAIDGDTTAPELSILNPARLTPTESTVMVQGLCEIGASFITVTGDIEPLTSDVICSDNGDFFVDLTLPGALGTKTVLFSQSDRSGNRAQITWDLVKADLTAPAVGILSPVAGFRTFESFNISGTCETGNQTVAISGDIVADTNTPCDGNGRFNVSINLSAGLGNKTIRVTQMDTSGNAGMDTRVFERIEQVIDDTTPPLVTITSPAANTQTESLLNIQGTCEAGAGPVQLAGQITQINTDCNNSGQYGVSVQLASGLGNKTVNISQQDNAGNIGTVSRIYRKVDLTAPTLTIENPDSGASHHIGLTLQGTCETGASQITVSGDIENVAPVSCQAGNYSVDVIFDNGNGVKTVDLAQQDASLNVTRISRDFAKVNAPSTFEMAQSILQARCVHCHSSGGQAAQHDFELNTEQEFITAGLIVPGQVSQSKIVTRAQGYGASNSNMPLDASLPITEYNTLLNWVNSVNDSIAPVVSINLPASGFQTENGLTVSGTCEVGSSDLTISGDVESSNPTACSNSGTFSVFITFTAGIGTKTVTLSQQDLAGNVGSDSRSFARVDNAPPAIMISSPAADSQTDGALVLTGICEVGSGAVAISGDITTNRSVSCQNNGTFSANLILSGNNGSKAILVSQTDGSGNTGTDSRNFEKYVPPPLTPEERFTLAKNVINANCLGCHQSGGTAGHASFDLDNEIDFIREGFVSPGEIDRSKIIYRILNYGGDRSNMPLNSGPLSNNDYGILLDWVSQMQNYETPYACDPQVSPLASLPGTNAKRLSMRQYDNTLVDLLGFSLSEPVAEDVLANAKSGLYVPQDSGRVFSRENNAFTGDHVEFYFNMAESLASTVSTQYLQPFVTNTIALDAGSCTNPDINNLSTACRRSFIRNFASRAFRRTLRLASDNLTTRFGENINELNSLEEEFTGVSTRDGVNRFLIRVFMSPSFLFQVEDQNLIASASNSAEVHQLSDQAIISRLSYRFWNTMPDEQLWNIADSYDLSTDTGFTQALNHILSDQSKLDRGLREFYNEWLKLGRTPQFSATPQLDVVAGNVNYGPELRQAMIDEVEELGSFITSSGGSFDDLFMTDISFARDPELLKVYGLSTPAPTNITVNNAPRFPSSQQRAGVLTRAAMLVSGSELSSPILRGAHLRRDILCMDLGAPPNNALEQFNNTQVDYRLSTRDKTQIKTSGSSCVSCHSIINPIGFAFSNFDSMGAFISEEPIFDDNGTFTNSHVPVDSQVDLSNILGPGSQANNAREMSQLVASQISTKSCFNEKVFTYFNNRVPDVNQDACRLESTYQSLDPNSSLLDMARKLGEGAEFRYRKIENEL